MTRKGVQKMVLKRSLEKGGERWSREWCEKLVLVMTWTGGLENGMVRQSIEYHGKTV